MFENPLDSVLRAAGARFMDVAGVAMAGDYGDPAGEYAACRSGAGLYYAGDRGLIEVRGRDRVGWLHNLITNVVKALSPGQGCYAFAINVKGRILFDMNVLMLEDAIWLDVDRRFAAKALAHFDKHTITEDVQCRDRSGEWTRIGLCGPGAVGIAEALGAAQAEAMPALGWKRVSPAGGDPLGGAGVSPAEGADIAPGGGVGVSPALFLIRHDFAGVFGVELYVEVSGAAECWQRLLEIGRPAGLRPVGWSAVHVLRIEAGIPAYGQDIDEEVVPAETGQFDRAVSYTKGCYLGQEVVERMRSRGAVASKLVGLRFDGPVAAGLRAGRSPGDAGGPEEKPLTLKAGETDVGRVTSTCASPAVGGWIGLGYVRASHGNPGTRLTVAGKTPVEAEVVPLPFR